MDAREADKLHALIRAAGDGDPAATDALYSLLYREIYGLARQRLGGEQVPGILSPTVLVHDAYLRLAGQTLEGLTDRSHFLAIVARVMRRVLVDNARKRQALKRGQDPYLTTLVEDEQAGSSAVLSASEMLALDRAIEELAEHDADMARVVELRYFGGLTVAETAAALDCSSRSVNRLWRAARAWLALQVS